MGSIRKNIVYFIILFIGYIVVQFSTIFIITNFDASRKTILIIQCVLMILVGFLIYKKFYKK